MKRFSLLLSLLLVLAAGCSTSALADSFASYTISGTYDSSTFNTPLTAPGQNFTISFSLPTYPVSPIDSYVSGDDFYVYPIPVNYSFEGSTSTLANTLVAFYSSNANKQLGGFMVDSCATDVTCQTGFEYQWSLAGPQQYSGDESNPTLLPAGFSSSGQPFKIYDNFFTGYDSSISGSVTGCVVATPEPSALVLLLAGLAGIALFTRSRG